MAKSKKVAKQVEVDTDKTIENLAVEQVIEITDAENKPETPQTQPQKETKPLFTSDNEQEYRNLLLERPGVPVITNIQEAVKFVGRYEQWNRKVQLQFK